MKYYGKRHFNQCTKLGHKTLNHLCSEEIPINGKWVSYDLYFCLTCQLTSGQLILSVQDPNHEAWYIGSKKSDRKTYTYDRLKAIEKPTVMEEELRVVYESMLTTG